MNGYNRAYNRIQIGLRLFGRRTMPLGMTMILLFSMCLLGGCQASRSIQPDYTASGIALDTYVSVSLYGGGSQKIADDCLQLCSYYEAIFSSVSEDSTLYRANEEGGFVVSKVDERTIFLVDLIKTGLDYGVLTDGALDITVEPVAKLWNFGTNTGEVPSKDAIHEALLQVDYNLPEIIWTQEVPEGFTTDAKAEDILGYVDFHGTRIELGAIAKGYIADRMADYLKDRAVPGAIINLGGNILALGTKDGEKQFTVGVQKPFGSSQELLGKMQVSDRSVVTSGVYERYFEAAPVDGVYGDMAANQVLYHHILNPETGYPCENELYAVTIIAESSTVCDALSTGCFVLGLEKGMALVESLDGVEAVFVDRNNKLHKTSGADAYLR